MAGNAFDRTLAGFRRWAGTPDRKLHGDLERDADELGTLFGLMPDYLGIDSPAELTAGRLYELLMHVYPRKVTVLNREDTADTVPAVRDLAAYLADTKAITPAAAAALERELDKIEPGFGDAVLDPANWGPATAMVHALYRDGVDLDDKDAVDSWIAELNAGTPGGDVADDDYGTYDDLDDELTWETADLKADFGLPEIVAPARLPGAAELAALAAAAPLLADVLGLSRDVREKPVPVAGLDPFLLALAVAAEVVAVNDDSVVPGDDVTWLDDLSGEEAPQDAWEYAFEHVVDTTLDTADETEPLAGEELDLTGHGIALMIGLFQAGRAGLPVAELSAVLQSAATADVPGGDGDAQWQEWVGAHGDPASLLLAQLTRLNAVTVDGADDEATARLAPLGLNAVAEKLRECDVEVPVLPPAQEMTASDVAVLFALAHEADFAAEFVLWAAARTPEGAAREMLDFAAGTQVTARSAAVLVAARLGPAAEPAWREALDRPQLRCYAKPELLKFMADANPGLPVPPELKLTVEDTAWIVADTFAPLTKLISGDVTFPFDMTELGDRALNVTHEALFDAMSRLDHPDAYAVLNMIGRHCDDKRTAKAARKAAFKSASRQGTSRD